MLHKSLIMLMIPLLLIPAYAQETSTEIPTWVKGVANFWIEGNIDDGEFGEAITFLIEQGIIQIDSVTPSQMTSEMTAPISDEEKRLYELEIGQKDDRIKILENEMKDIGLDNAYMLNDLVEERQQIETLRATYENTKTEFKEYKENYPLKIGNIGGMSVVDYIQELEDRIKELENK